MKKVLMLFPALLLGCAPVAEKPFVYTPSVERPQTPESGVDLYALTFSSTPAEVLAEVVKVAGEVQYEHASGMFPFKVASQDASQVVLTAEPFVGGEPVYVYFDLILNGDGANLVFQMPGVSSETSLKVWQQFSAALKNRLAVAP